MSFAVSQSLNHEQFLEAFVAPLASRLKLGVLRNRWFRPYALTRSDFVVVVRKERTFTEERQECLSWT
jgi:hypothetical protein